MAAAGAGGPAGPRVDGTLGTAEAIALIGSARTPADLFAADAARRYRLLARLTHPDSRPGDDRAAAAFARLSQLWQRHQARTGAGALAARGDLANLYLLPAGLLKLARDPADNDLMDREATALATLGAQVPARLAAYFPRLAEVRRVVDPRSGVMRRANLIGRLDGFVTLAQVRAAFPGGLDARDAAWMWRRLLVAIGAAHQAGLVHGAVLPEHVLIHPAKHGLALADWCYAGPPGSPLPAIVGRYRDWYPPEVPGRGPAGPDTDIWLASACMTDLTGNLLAAPLGAFARGCMLASPARRPRDAWRLLAELDDLLGRLYGPRRFRPFAMPA